MKLVKFISSVVLVASALVFTACTANTDTVHQKSTAFGIWTFNPACYTPSDGMGITVRTEQMSGMELPSGDKLSLFWGLVSFEDY